MTALPANTSHQFATLCGATVAIITDPDVATIYRHRWTCLGCDAGPCTVDALQLVRTAANEHAGTCRALPKPGA